MPQGDRTGPLGMGPLTGRGRGICGRLLTTARGNRRVIWPALLATVVGTVIKDAGNQDGLTRRSLGYLRNIARKVLLRAEREDVRIPLGQEGNRKEKQFIDSKEEQIKQLQGETNK